MTKPVNISILSLSPVYIQAVGEFIKAAKSLSFSPEKLTTRLETLSNNDTSGIIEIKGYKFIKSDELGWIVAEKPTQNLTNDLPRTKKKIRPRTIHLTKKTFALEPNEVIKIREDDYDALEAYQARIAATKRVTVTGQDFKGTKLTEVGQAQVIRIPTTIKYRGIQIDHIWGIKIKNTIFDPYYGAITICAE